ncbi:MAG: gliding motility-associated C-terminal domain-containing protein [Bacteroidetes bacterium]|nr:gliding motility-associated C-terminal domain-containing protein [Bacteroidota bacterium]
MKNRLALLLILFYAFCQAQTILPQVINSAGDHRTVGSSGITLTDNVGEPFIETIGPAGNIMITQGFLQPDIISILGPGVSILKNDVSCSDKRDGNISVALSNSNSNYVVSYSWSPVSVCPTGNCSKVDSLLPGNYSVMVIFTNTLTSKTDTIKPAPIQINDQNGPCSVKIYNGITPNGDGENDVWIIDNISDFPNNHVCIFNRWGNKVFETDGYNNSSKSWPKKDEVQGLVASTYFYVLTLGNGTILKGWIEILKS